jgi:hypothetical protein
VRARNLGLLVIAVLVLAGTAWWLLDRQAAGEAAEVGPALPGFDARVEAVDRIEVHGAGGKRLLAIEKRDGRWLMPDRQDWPANQREVGSALFRLGQARRIEAKTANPSLHARLGVEDIGADDAGGTELHLSGGGEPLRLTIGNNHPTLGGSYVRIGDDPQAWLLDEDIAPARAPADWLDRRLLDIPMARIDQIRVTPATGRAFRLSRVQDRFSLDGQPPAAMENPDAGNSTAGFTDQLPLDDVAPDSGAEAEQTVVFEGVDGVVITVAAWRHDGATWARLRAELDEARAAEWIAQRPASGESGDEEAQTADAASVEPAVAIEEATPEQQLADLKAQVEQWQASFDSRQFLLPPYKSAPLMRSRNDYLAGGQ